MREQHPIDQFFRDQLSNREVDYQPADWNEAEKLLNDHQKKRFFLYRFRFYLSAFLLLLISGITFLLINNSNEPSSETSQQVINSVSKDKTYTIKESEKLENDQSSNQMSAKIENISQPSSSLNEPENMQQTSFVPTKVPNNQMVIDNDEQAENNVVQNNSSPNLESGISSAKKNESPVDDVPIMMTSSKSKDNENIDYSIHASKDIPVLTASISTLPETSTLSQTTNNSNNNMMSAIQMISVDSEVLNSSLLEEPEPDMDKIQPQHSKVSGFKVIAGAGITPVVTYEGGSSKDNYTYFLGLGYEKLIKPKFSLELRALWSRRNAFGVTQNVVETYYDFGYRQIETNYEYHNLNYIEIPLMAHYIFHPLHQVGFGIQYSRLIQTEFISTSTEESTIGNQAPIENKGKHATGAFNGNDFAIYVGYQYRLVEKLQIGLNAQIGLSNVIDNQQEKNHQMRIFLTYRLFK